ncbi:MAG: hypothetical protein K2J74_05340 [Muribaculaceae bacterium]|nr:hypothetical protein [Muribaculaceae bacterium]
MKEEVINSVMQSRGVMVLIAIGAFVLSFYEWEMMPLPDECATSGLLGNLVTIKIVDYPIIACVYNYICMALIGVSMLLLNKRFLFLGNMSSLFVSLFLIFETMIPSVGGSFSIGTTMALVLMCLLYRLYAAYKNKENRARIFMIFAILSALAAVEISAVYAIPLFWLGVWQLRALSVKSATAAVVGLATPYWIIFGLGIMPVDSLQFPMPTPIWELETIPHWALAVVFVVFVTIMSLTMNFFTLMKYKLRTRLYNSFTILFMLWSIIMIIIDSLNAEVYITVLMACASMQISHLYSATDGKRRYILLLVLIALSLGITFITSSYLV